jgi:hypothetical protein
MAFSEGMARRARKIQPGDQLVLYLARGAFHNPTRDHSQLAGLATVTNPLERSQRSCESLTEFTWGCDLELTVVLPERRGIPIQFLVPQLSFVQHTQHWGISLRPGLLALPDADLELVTTAIRNGAGETGA